MTIKKTIQKLRRVAQGFDGIAQAEITMDAGMKVARVMREVNNRLEEYEAVKRTEMKKLGATPRLLQTGATLLVLNVPQKGADEKDDVFAARLKDFDDKCAKWAEKLDELDAQEVEVAVEPLDPAIFKGANVKPADLEKVLDFLDAPKPA